MATRPDFCRNCGVRLTPGQRFCVCGARVVQHGPAGAELPGGTGEPAPADEVATYVKAMRALGRSDEDIHQALRTAGWSDEGLSSITPRLCHSSREAPHPPTCSRPTGRAGPGESPQRRPITVRQIIQAIYGEDLSGIERRLREGAHPGHPDRDAPHDTPLHQAALLDSPAAAELLLQYHADPNPRDANGDTPLHVAAMRGAIGVTRLLLQGRAEVDVRNERGETPLMWVSYNHYEVVEVAQLLLGAGAGASCTSDRGWSPLHAAAANGYARIAGLLMAAGADACAQTTDGHKPVDLAAVAMSRETVALLLRRGAACTLHAAVVLGDAQGVTHFLRAGCDANVVAGPEHLTPLHLVAAQGDTRTGTLLLDSGADVNARDDTGRAPLHEAVYGEHLAMATLLLQRGADPNAKAKRIGAPLKRAMKRDMAPMVGLLRSYGARD